MSFLNFNTMKGYYQSPYSHGITFAFIRSLCKLTGDDELDNPYLQDGKPMPAVDGLFRRKLRELSAKYGIKVEWFKDSTFPREINQVANELISNGIIDEYCFLIETEQFLQSHPAWIQLPPHLSVLRKPLV